MERTFSIIKPDAVQAGKAGAIIQHLTDGGLRPVALKMLHLTKAQAEGFYYVHKARPFFGDLVRFMETRPMSKSKRWRLVEVVERAAVVLDVACYRLEESGH